MAHLLHIDSSIRPEEQSSPAMIPLDLGPAEDQSLADAHAAIDALFASGSPA